MGNVMRHRYGAKNPVLGEVESAVVVEVGDLTILLSNKVKNFFTKANASIADCGEIFLGVAMQASASGETDPIRIATSGVFEYPMASSTVYLGYTVLPVAGTNSIEDQIVAVAAQGTMTNAIGIAIPEGGSGVGGTTKTKVLVDIKSTIFGNEMD